VEFRILGPLEVLDSGRDVTPARAKQRALLSMLLLHANEVLARDQLIEALWGGAPPPSGQAALNGHVSALRKLLGADRIETRPPGYVLRLSEEELDVCRFQALLAEGRERSEPEARAALLRSALALWRGEPLADVRYEPFAQHEIARLEELRQSIVEERIDADLAQGRHVEIIPELEQLVAEHPFRERLRGQLMLALYRSGRQADALQVFQEGRTLLIGELGIEAGATLRQLQNEILNQDPSLALKRPDRAAGPPEQAAAQPGEEGKLASVSFADVSGVTGQAARMDPEGRRRRLIRRSRALVAGVFVLGGAIAALVIEGRKSSAGQISPNTIAVVDPASSRVTGQIRARPRLTDAAVGAGAVWILDPVNGAVIRVNPAAPAVVQTIGTGHAPAGLVYSSGAVWVSNGFDGTVSRIDPAVNRVVQKIPVGATPAGLAADGDSVWVANNLDETLTRIDSVTGRATATIPVGVKARSVAVAAGAVWVTDEDAGRVLRVDPRSKQITASVAVGNGPVAISAAAGSLWVANSLDGTVSRLDPGTGRVTATITTGSGPHWLAAASAGVWVSNEFGGDVVRIDPRSNRIVHTIRLWARAGGVAEANGRLVVVAGASSAAHRGGTLRVLSSLRFDSLDPAIANLPTTWSLLTMTNDGLTGFERVDGPDGTRLVPDLAIALPQPQANGRVYTFRLRPGIRYSDGSLVRPMDFRRAIERVLVLRSAGAGYYENILGARFCRATACDLSAGIVADDNARTVTFRLLRRDPEFFYKLALPFAFAVPASTPLKVLRLPLPATGPYVLRRSRPQTVKLLRNALFREWSRAAQPDGYPDVIRWRADRRNSDISVVRRNAGDLFYLYGQTRGLEELATRFASRLHIAPLPHTAALLLNAKVPPFNDIRVRRALNYAIDRQRIVRISGGSGYVKATCQILPVNFPGHIPYCPYTQHPTAAGEWSGPDLAKARRLIAASSTRGERVTLWARKNIAPGLAPYVVMLLRQLGYRASLKTLPDRSFFADVYDSRTNAQMASEGWLADFPAPSNFLLRLSCQSLKPADPSNPNGAEFCDPAIDREMKRALALEATNPNAALRLWSRVDHQLVDQAPWVPLYNPVWVDFVSQRVGNYQHNPQWHPLIDQMWVRQR
jgi:YVTN family beta-propeller protein